VDNKTPTGVPPFSILLRSLSSHLGDLHVLFWRLDVRKNELTFLNDGSWSGLGERLPLILRNPTYARDALMPEDRSRFFECFDKIRGQQSASTVVRVRDTDGSVSWVTLVGFPDPLLASNCIGFVADCSRLAATIASTHSDTDAAHKIELFDHPVLLARFRDHRIVLANAAAHALLGDSVTSAEGRLSLEDLVASSPSVHTSEILESLLFNDQWSGSVTVPDRRGNPRVCAAKIRALSQAGEHYLWVLLYPETPDRTDGPAGADVLECPPVARKAFAAAASIEDLLRAFLVHQPNEVRAEAVMRSRIFGSQNRVVVTGIAESLAAMPSKETFAYEGSVAENIIRFGFDHLIVEDTSRSIKPIDWVLFIPKGIRSYFAKPFFEDGVLKNVFIVCSTEVGRFTEQNVRCYLPFLGEIEAALNNLEETVSSDGGLRKESD
jgi:PAS domain-containing protein